VLIHGGIFYPESNPVWVAVLGRGKSFESSLYTRRNSVTSYGDFQRGLDGEVVLIWPMGIPLTIAHFGGSPQHLRLSLTSAAQFNREVVLIGDRSNTHVWENHWNSDQPAMAKLRNFMDSYVKMSDYPDWYEAAFWKRPFIVEAWMKSEGVKELFLIDSDILSFADYSKEVAPLLPNNCRATVIAKPNQTIEDWATSLHFSYWTREALGDFTDFCIYAYKEPSIRMKLEAKYRWHIENLAPGGICEMTLLHLWAEKNSSTVFNLAKAINNCVVDGGIAMSTNYFDDEFEMRGGFKRLVFRNGVPYGFNKVFNREIQFWCLHCQGGSKRVMWLLQCRGLRAYFPQVDRLNRFFGSLKRKSKSYIHRTLNNLVRGNRKMA
jgi:hypothetical protein